MKTLCHTPDVGGEHILIVNVLLGVLSYCVCLLGSLIDMDPSIYRQITNYKSTGKYPDGFTKTEKNTFRKIANTFDIEGKIDLIVT